METVLNRLPAYPGAARSLADAVAQVIAPHEHRKRARKKVAQVKYDESLRAFVGRIANVAMNGRGWLAEPFGNDVLKAKGGPGICLVAIRDGMKAAGLIEALNGYYDRRIGQGRLSRIRATLLLRAMMAQHGISLPVATRPEQTAVLRNAIAPMTARVAEQDATVRRFNAFAERRRLSFADGLASPEVYLVRKFKGDWTTGGRLYGGFWQALSKIERQSLRIEGEAVVELDFRTMQPRILYGLKGLPLTFDPYLVPGFNVDRETGKLAYNRLVNGKRRANRACPLDFTADFAPHFADRAEFRRFVAGMEKQLSAVSECFGLEPWGMLQREESELLLSILDECLDADLAAYPIHDSLIVRASDREVAKSIMLDAFKFRYGVDAEVA